MTLKTHVKILGYIYTGLAFFTCLCAILILIAHAVQGGLSQAGRVFFILIVVALWWLWVGQGLLYCRRGVRLYAVIVALILMVGLNSLLLLFGGEPFSSAIAWIIFHLACISIGIYTIVIMVLPGTRDVFDSNFE